MEPLAVCTGAAAGALLRWRITEEAKRYGMNPWSTMGINVCGSFILGACSSQKFQNSNIPLLVGTGFCGSFTTLSSYSVDVLTMLQKGQHARAGALIFITNAASLGAAGLGYKLFKHKC
jgi:CrcB protein